MSRRVKVQTEAPGQDSFLDVVANLVGVLIILVMVVGTQAKQVMVQAIAAVPQTDVDKAALTDAQNQLQMTEVQMLELEAKIRAEEFAIAQRHDERSRLLIIAQLAERELEAEKAKMSEKERGELDANAKRRALEQELDRLQKTMAGIDSEPSKTEVIQHYPTPLAKTVFDNEAHFRLSAGRIVRIPWDELMAALQAEAKDHAWKLKNSNSFTETLGPIQDFRLQYTLHKVEQRGAVGVQLKLALFLPMDENVGEPLTKALQQNSDFQFALKELDPRVHKVTIWTYPDSFKEFRETREFLHKRGFVTAGRPLPEGQPVGASPEGTRSSAQ
jgi:hypothetical protein